MVIPRMVDVDIKVGRNVESCNAASGDGACHSRGHRPEFPPQPLPTVGTLTEEKR